jgi:hypothetical protein
MSNLNFPISGSTILSNYIYPEGGSGARFGILHDFYLIGGYQVLSSISDRNNIPIQIPGTGQYYSSDFIDETGFGSGRRKIGMLVYVQELDETYRLLPKGYFGNGGTGATGSAEDWLALDPWEKAVLLDPSQQNIPTDVRLTDPSFFPVPTPATYDTVSGSGNPDDCWVRVSTETETTFIEAYLVSSDVYGGTGSKGILGYSSDTNFLVRFPSTNTGPATLSIDGFSDVDIKKQTLSGLQDLSPGDILTDVVYPVFYDGTYFQIPVLASNLGIYSADGSVLTNGATGIKFIGTGVSVSEDNGFVTVEITGGSGGSPISVYGTGGNLLSSGATGFIFTGVGVSSGSSNDFITVDISEYKFPSDIPVSIESGLSFGKYENGDTVPASGKTVSEVIQMALVGPINPTVNLSTTTSNPLDFNTQSVSNSIVFSHTILSSGATVSSALLEYRRGSGSWTTLSTSTASSGTYVHTDTNAAFNITAYIYRYTVTDTAGGTSFATLTMTFENYVAPTVTISVSATSGTTSPETTLKREIGNIASTISGTITRNSPLVPLNSYYIRCQTNGSGPYLPLVSGSASGSSFSVPSYNHFDAGLSGSSSLVYRIDAVDSYQTTTSSLVTVNFKYLIFYGSSSSAPSNSSSVRALPSSVFVDTPNPFVLSTGTTNRIFTAAMPATLTLNLAIDQTALNADITNNYVNGLSTFNVNDYGGVAVSYKVYTMTNSIAYSDKSHNHQITHS